MYALLMEMSMTISPSAIELHKTWIDNNNLYLIRKHHHMADIPNLELTYPINVAPLLFPFPNFGEKIFQAILGVVSLIIF